MNQDKDMHTPYNIEPPRDQSYSCKSTNPTNTTNFHNRSSRDSYTGYQVIPPSYNDLEHVNLDMNTVQSVNKIVLNDVYPNQHSATTTIANTYGLPNRLQKDLMEDIFSTMAEDSPTTRIKPLVVLDCANIGWSYGIHRFNVHGVILAIQYFQQLEIEIQAFIPVSYIRLKPRLSTDDSRENALMVTDEVELLTQLTNNAIVTIVPTGDNDDAYILNYGRDNNGFIISNDLFQDHINNINVESTRFSMSIWIHEHRCGYTFTRNHNTTSTINNNNSFLDINTNNEFLFNQSSILRFAIERYHYNQYPIEYKHKHNQYLDQIIQQISNILDNMLTNNLNRFNVVEDHNNNSGNTSENNNNNNNMKMEIKWLLLSRASLQLKADYASEALSTVIYILQNIDSHCLNSQRLYKECQDKIHNNNDTTITSNDPNYLLTHLKYTNEQN